MKHTAGPWKWEHSSKSYGHFVAVDGLVICVTPKATTDRYHDTDTANVQLMAAAPDMLSALKRAEKGLCYDLPSEIHETIKIVRDAIAKAEPTP